MSHDTLAIERPTTTAPATAAPLPRLDLYMPIHKALRAALANMLVTLGSLDPADAAECERVLGSLRSLLDLMAGHLQHEERFMHPALEAAERGLVGGIDAEHDAHRATIAALRAEADALQAAPDETAALRLYRHFALFVAENLEHMHVEETQLNAVLWAYYSDGSLGQIHDRLVGSIEPAEMGQVLHWMLPALNPVQRAGMLGEMQSKAPPEAVRPVLALAQQRLDTIGWAKLATALGLPHAAR